HRPPAVAARQVGQRPRTYASNTASPFGRTKNSLRFQENFPLSYNSVRNRRHVLRYSSSNGAKPSTLISRSFKLPRISSVERRQSSAGGKPPLAAAVTT